MNSNHKKIVNRFNSDIKSIVAVLIAFPFIIDPLIAILNSFQYMIKWWWIMPLISVVFLVGFVTSEPFKLWMLSRKDLKENKVLKKEIVVGKFENDYSIGRRAHAHNLTSALVNLVLPAFEKNIKTLGGDDKYILADSENNTYHLMNYYKTKMRKKDLEKPLLYSSLKGRTIEIEYLEESKLILSMKMDKHDKNSKLVGGFAEIFGGYMV